MHEALIKEALGQGIVGHVSRNSTAIPVREKPTPKGESDQKPMKRKRGRPRKGEVRPPKAKTRLERQAAGDMTLGQMLDDLPKACDIGAKVDAQGFKKFLGRVQKFPLTLKLVGPATILGCPA